MAQKRRKLEIDIDLVPGNKRLAVLVLDEQAANGDRERERIELHLLDGNFAVELLGQLFDRHGADDGRQDEEAGDGVEQQQPQNPEQQLAPSRRKGIPSAKFYFVTQANKNLRVTPRAVNSFVQVGGAFPTERAAEVGVASGQIPQLGLGVRPGLGMNFAAQGTSGQNPGRYAQGLAGGFEFGRQLIAMFQFQPDFRNGHGVDYKRRKMNVRRLVLFTLPQSWEAVYQ